MRILGINAYHGDASAALLADGQLLCAVEEERLSRLKHAAGLPVLAAARCLQEAGLELGEVDRIGVSRRPSAHLLRKMLYAARRLPTGAGRVADRLRNVARVRDVKGGLARAMGVAEERVRAELVPIEHHVCHVASAFFPSGFEEAALLSVDGFGDYTSTLLGKGTGTSIQVLERVHFPHSLGLFYTAISQYLGFRKYGDEGKVMGLASYGTPRFRDAMRKIVILEEDGLFHLDTDYFIHHTEGVDMTWDAGTPTLGNVFSPRLAELLGPSREPGSSLAAFHEDVAASLQAHLEDAILHIVRRLHARVGGTRLAMAGGVALNCIANGRVLRETPYRELFIQPAAGDGGTSLGAALYLHHAEGGRRDFVMRNAYTGPSYDEAACRAALETAGLRWRKVPNIEEECARIVAEGKILGWFQGRVEFGPRALGNRSIVADPRRKDMKDILNQRIKHREPFRPFAPSVLAEHTGEWFEESLPSPFMLLAYPVRPEKRDVVPAITHVDGTGRLQTVTREENPKYYALIDAFRRLTGVPLVLNTSFNENEPIVCTPEDAIRCYVETKMDALVLGDLLAVREE